MSDIPGQAACVAGRVVSVNVSRVKGTRKMPATQIVLDDRGVAGDAHAGLWHRQVSLLGQEAIEEFVRVNGRTIEAGEFGENITLDGLDMERAVVLDRIHVGECELEVTQVGKHCHGQGCEIFQQVGKCIMPKQGLFCRVIRSGVVKAGDVAKHIARPLRVAIITMSDRASAGEYKDRSGPVARAMLEEHFAKTRWRLVVKQAILPDEAAPLALALRDAIDAGVDVVFTLGGTGIGPRDVTSDVVAAQCEKMLPGVMEAIRAKYGAENPMALLSRSVAGVAKMTQLYALPGSPNAVSEYLTEVLKVLEHAILMLHGIGH